MSFRQLAAELGWFDAALYATHGVLQRIDARLALTSYWLVAQPVPRHSLLPAGRGSSVTIRRAAPDDAMLAHIERPPAELARRFAAPGACLLAEKGGRVVGYLWLVFGTYCEPDDRCCFTPWPPGQAAWDLDIYVDPAERLGTTFVRLWDAGNALLRERGIHWTLSRIAGFNVRSRASHARFGSMRVGRLNFLRLFGLQLYLGSVWPYVAVSFRTSAGPQIRARVPRAPKLMRHGEKCRL
jgi:hypothetical protein